MDITTNHPASSYGTPVIIDDRGGLMSYRAGLIAACEALGWSRAELATRAGMKPRSLEPVFMGYKPPSAAVLNFVRDELEKLSHNS